MKTLKALEVVTDGFEDLEALGTSALLRRAQIDLTLAAIDATSAIGRYGTEIIHLENLSQMDISLYDLLIIPGGPEYIAEERNPEFLKMVKNFHDQGKAIAAICAGPTILGHLGLLRGKNYTCFPSMNEDFGGTFHDVPSVIDGNLITGRSCAGTIDFALNIIKHVCGDDVLEKIKTQICY